MSTFPGMTAQPTLQQIMTQLQNTISAQTQQQQQTQNQLSALQNQLSVMQQVVSGAQSRANSLQAAASSKKTLLGQNASNVDRTLTKLKTNISSGGGKGKKGSRKVKARSSRRRRL
jgi:ABC-type transporter Mla subunit MlaD